MKKFSHECYRSHWNLQLLFFVRNLNPSLTCSFFSLKNSGHVQYWTSQFWKLIKRKAFGALFGKTSTLRPIIFCFLQLFSYNFFPKSASNGLKIKFPKTIQLIRKLAVLYLVGFCLKIRTHYLKWSKPWAYVNMQCVGFYLNVQSFTCSSSWKTQYLINFSSLPNCVFRLIP